MADVGWLVEHWVDERSDVHLFRVFEPAGGGLEHQRAGLLRAGAANAPALFDALAGLPGVEMRRVPPPVW